ncbi:hypothetical protein RB2654_15170 [Rhodobacterales bacterium HTCC2654]|uniref:Uncharacterized protein n=1 Tax=Maritimibacter alkaliphilus HTCC2654 TaxID=314271 RepID=A3VH83_9RHOB|nr:hypothetical protein RB2654_15170 [Rhodobacterales bacterium HTCC2654] [Maritimibacter alkaliphilus HTCC2654]
MAMSPASSTAHGRDVWRLFLRC